MSQDSKPGSTAAERQPDNVTKYTALPATKGPIPQVLRYDLKKKKVIYSLSITLFQYKKKIVTKCLIIAD